jgi:hypothetical protein
MQLLLGVYCRSLVLASMLAALLLRVTRASANSTRLLASVIFQLSSRAGNLGIGITHKFNSS